MSECVIVAIPEDESVVHEISSEKIAHMTLLYLGELSPEIDKQNITEFVEHATSQLKPFGVTVDYRGTLGDDSADVLFFEKQWLDRVYNFRAALLTNEQINAAYNSAFQYPSWTPHLTLGYPDTPARKPSDPDRALISYIRFDRIAVWFGDFEGPTFRMNAQSEMAIEQSETLTDFLAHYGVKGMRWGTRKDGLTRSRARAVEKDRAWIEDAQLAYNKVATPAAKYLNKEVLPQINAKYAVDGFVRNSEYDAYSKDLTKAYEDALDKAMYAAIGRSPSGKHSLKWHAEQADIKLPWAELVYSEKKMAHADTAPMIVRFVQSEDGSVEVEVVSREEFESSIEEAEHSMVDNIDDFLAHYGVKGMRWGVRQDRGSSSSKGRRKSASDKDDDAPTKSKKSGAQEKNDLSRYSDDKLTSMAAKLKGLDALSDAELSKLTKRMQLEQSYRDLQARIPKEKSKVEKFLNGAKILGDAANKVTELTNSPAGEALQKAVKSRAKAKAKK